MQNIAYVAKVWYGLSLLICSEFHTDFKLYIGQRERSCSIMAESLKMNAMDSICCKWGILTPLPDNKDKALNTIAGFSKNKPLQ